MPLKLELSSKGTIEVITRKDSAVSHCTEEQYDSYLEDLDEEKLELTEEQPTRFVLRKVLPYEATQEILSQQVKVEKGKTQLNIGYILEEVRRSLVDIKNPEGIPDTDKILFKRDSDGAANKELVNALHNAGLAMDLWRARQNVAGGVNTDVGVKKS